MREDLPLLPLYFELVPFVCRCAHSSMMGPPVVVHHSFQYFGSTTFLPPFRHLSTTTIHYLGSTFRLFTSSLFQVLVLVVAWLASSLAFAGLQPEPARLLTGDRFLDLALQGPLTFLLCIDLNFTTPLLLGGLAIATALLTGLLAAGFGRRYSSFLLFIFN